MWIPTHGRMGYRCGTGYETFRQFAQDEYDGFLEQSKRLTLFIICDINIPEYSDMDRSNRIDRDRSRTVR